MKTRYIRIVIALLLGLGLSLAVVLYQGAPSPTDYKQNVAGASIGGSLAGFVNHKGQTVSEADFANKTQLVFFGFTHCPSICPTELQKITLVLNALNETERAQLAPIFVTVDPERDTPETLEHYLSMFHPDIIGLHGTEAQTEQVKKDWKVYASRFQSPEMTEYTVDHSAFTYLRAPDGGLIALFSMTDSPEAMISAVKQQVKR